MYQKKLLACSWRSVADGVPAIHKQTQAEIEQVGWLPNALTIGLPVVSFSQLVEQMNAPGFAGHC